MLELNEDYQIRYTAYEKNPENYIDTENSNFDQVIFTKIVSS